MKGRDFHLEIATTYRRREQLGRALVTGWAIVDGKRIDIRERHTQRSLRARRHHRRARRGRLESDRSTASSIRGVRGSA